MSKVRQRGMKQVRVNRCRLCDVIIGSKQMEGIAHWCEDCLAAGHHATTHAFGRAHVLAAERSAHD